jgi:cytochrome c5
MTHGWFLALSGLVGGLLALTVVACGESTGKSQGPGAVPAEFAGGERKFRANCSRCHGEQAAGTEHGPPLVHKIYEPNHHGYPAFHRAAANGVVAHHWQFGNMPPIPTVTPVDVDEIIAYVRWLQRQAGIM